MSLEEEETKRALKEGLQEWLDGKFSEFGKWSFRALAAAAFIALVYFILVMNGWHR